MSSHIHFEGDIGDKLEKKIVSGIKDGKRYGPEGEWLGSTYESEEMSKFWESALGTELGKKLGAELGYIRGPTDMF